MTQPLPSPGELVRAYGRPAKKSFGQNFLTDAAILDRIVAHARVDPDPGILEIGPGPGGLTARLLHAGHDVTAIEMDEDCVEHLRSSLGSAPGFRVVQGDALTEALDEALGDPPRVVVANLPYHVATEILFRLVDRPEPPPRMVLMFQREVALRICSGGADREFGLLAVGVSIRYEVRTVLRLGPGAFRPPPKVESSVVLFRRREAPLCDPETEVRVRQLARAAFGQRRKMIRNTLAPLFPDVEASLRAAGLGGDVRPEALRVEDFIRLAGVSG